jgi:shikimate kinase
MAVGESIFLIGPMGSGKTTVGGALGERLGLDCYDSDDYVETITGAPIPDLFKKLGEAGFRDREEMALETLTQASPIILATGGGAVLRRNNRQRLSDRGTVIYLSATVATQLARTQGSSRPLLRTEDPQARLTALLAERDPLYRATAHHVVATDNADTEAAVETIIELTGRAPGDTER